MSSEYRKAYDASTEAFNMFTPIRDAYIAGKSKYSKVAGMAKVTDAEYLAAKKIYDAAMLAFDLAYAAAQDACEEEAVEVSTQMEMFQ